MKMKLERYPLKEKIEAEMIRRAVIHNGNATITLANGEKTVFHYGMNIDNLPKKLKMTDPTFYDKFRDEIFDELHPY